MRQEQYDRAQLERSEADDAAWPAWISEVERIAKAWDEKHGNYPYSLPLLQSTGHENWRDTFDDGMTPQEAFDEDQKHWEP